MPSSAIDPVLSSTSATRSRVMPHLASGRSSQVERLVSEHPHKFRIKSSCGLDLNVGAASRAVGDLDIDVLGLLGCEEGLEVLRRVCLQLVFGVARGLLREHQRGGIERGLHGRLDQIGATVIDGGADKADDWQGCEGECDCDVAGLRDAEGGQGSTKLLPSIHHGAPRKSLSPAAVLKDGAKGPVYRGGPNPKTVVRIWGRLRTLSAHFQRL